MLSTTESECSVFVEDRHEVFPYAPFFPQGRSERVTPGHLVAVATASAGSPSFIVWRWIDAVVIDATDGMVALWEPIHGVVTAVPRDADRAYRPGARAYVSAGMPGADWWLAGPVVDRAEDADVDLDEVEHFLASLI